jgi:hypothetical protein
MTSNPSGFHLLILDLITLVSLGDNYNHESLHCVIFLHTPVTSSFLGKILRKGMEISFRIRGLSTTPSLEVFVYMQSCVSLATLKSYFIKDD